MRWANQTDSGQNNLPPSEDRWAVRSETYPGIADAMAAQWNEVLLSKETEFYKRGDVRLLEQSNAFH